MEYFWNILDGLAIARWEAIFFALLIGVYILMGLFRSVLIITFGFTFYWGFKNFAFFFGKRFRRNLGYVRTLRLCRHWIA